MENPLQNHLIGLHRRKLVNGWRYLFKKVQVGNYQEKAQSERNSHSKKRRLTSRYTYTKKTCNPSEQLFPNRRPLSTNGTTTEVSPWNDQLYKITGGLKLILQAPNLTLIFCSGSQHLSCLPRFSQYYVQGYS